MDLGCGGDHNDFHLANALNPELEYLKGEMRDVRLGRRFDAVLIADAGSYLLARADLKLAFETASAERFKEGAARLTQHSRGG